MAMLFWRYVLAIALVVLCSTANAQLVEISVYLPSGGSCADAGPKLYIKEDVCYSVLPGTSFKADTQTTPSIHTFANSQDCTGSSESVIPYTQTSLCVPSAALGEFKIVQGHTSVPDGGASDVVRRREEFNVPVDGSCATKSSVVDLTYEITSGQCIPSGLSLPMYKYLKITKADISAPGYEAWVTETYFSDAACSSATYSSIPYVVHSCYHTDVGLDASCASAPCSGAIGQKKNIVYNANVADTTVNYAKLRFYQDNTCRHPTTYMDPTTNGIAGIEAYNGANTGQTGNLNTDGTYFRTGEQVFDGNAPGQVLYLPVDTDSNSDVCTQVETGPATSPINSIKCNTGTGQKCELYLDTACANSAASLLNDTTTCNPTIFAKAEGFSAGIHLSSTSAVTMQFAATGTGVLGLATNPRKAQECGGIPSILVSELDTCHVNAGISTGHTWDTVQQEFRCTEDWDTQYEQATIEPTAAACMARCTAMDCLAISYGKDFLGDNHKCVLCKDVTGAGHSKWDMYKKLATPPFVKITTGTGSIDTFKTTYHTESDCSGVGLTPLTDINRLSTCRSVAVRAGHTRASQDAYLGAITLTQTMSPTQKVAAVKGAAVMLPSDEVGCPDVVNYVYTEGLYTFETSNGVNNNRVCAVHFIGAPGTMLAIDFSSFSMATGSCHGTPAECMCLEETVTVRDGLRSDARAVGQSLCGNFEPGRFLLSGNTGRMDIVSTQASSTFTVYVTHLINKVNIKTPANPSFALGSPIQLEWFTDASVGNWAECGTGAPQMSQMHGVGKKTPQDESWNRQYSCARSPASDHGWIGIYRNGTCEDGPMVPHAETDAASVAEGVHAHAYAQGQKPHECYLGYKSIPKRHTRGTVTFEYGKDYFSSGDYSLRFFSGESAGRVCEVLPSSAETDPYEHKRLQCHYSPVSRAEVHVTTNRATYSGSTEKSQLPGYERTINY